ncbi:MAG TPA: PIG-L family deacetylase [Terriglobales bacterium]|nr:PIG-L family deacetylase [Terriglobales bacterium]
MAVGIALFPSIHVQAQPAGMFSSADLDIALHKLDVLGSVLYVAAHPDDENTAVLSYFSKGRKFRTAYLSLTRGEGGQNLIGPEQGAEIGIIRTQELLSARRIDGAEQYFTRAVDFGYSKTAEETFEFWGKEKVLSDIVWVIRKFQPDVIITRFTADNAGGHGHHRASAILTVEAFTAAADPSRFPEQLKYVSPWKARRLFWNGFPQSTDENPNRLRLNTGEYNPLLGKSYNEMAAEGRSQHKSQGFGSAGRRGTQHEYFELLAGEPARGDLFDGIDVTWDRVPGGHRTGQLLAESLRSFDPEHPASSIPGLLAAHEELAGLPDENWVRLKKQELARVIQACGGIWMEAMAGDFAAAPGDEIQVKTTIINRSDQPFTVHSLGFPKMGPDAVLDRPLKSNEPAVIENSLHIPKDFPLSQPYWLDAAHQEGLFSVGDQNLIGLAENPPAICAKISLNAGGHLLEYSIPVAFRWTDQVNGELLRPFEVRPRLTIQVEDKVHIFADASPQKIKLRLKSHSPNVAGEVRLKGQEAWKTSPAGQPFSLTSKYEEVEVAFDVSPPKAAGETDLTAEADIGGEKISRELVEISYPHIRRQVYFPESRFKVVKLDIKTDGKRIGYITGAGDEVPKALQNLGYDVVELSDETLENADLSSFDTIITGVRAYNTRDVLKLVKERLLQYVDRGGTLVVQYNVASGSLADRIGPYPFTIGRDRVSVENAPVVFLAPGHPLLNVPNKITAKDFEGWIQERGLYFASQWDEKYETVLACHDPGEPDRKGGLLYARYGKGIFVYTAYAWFRQLPAGVPGAFRIFANIISAGKTTGKPRNGNK